MLTAMLRAVATQAQRRTAGIERKGYPPGGQGRAPSNGLETNGESDDGIVEEGKGIDSASPVGAAL